MARRDLVQTLVSVDGTPLGEFRAFSGGELTSADIKSVRGAGQAEQARGGRQTVGNVTVTREDDGTVNVKALASRRGKAPMVVTRLPLDDDGNPRSADKVVYSGVLLAVTFGEGDTAADTDLDEFTLEMSCHGNVA